jgi:hypothetical protein
LPTEGCELCGRATGDLTRHHLIPRTRHANKRNKREFDRNDVHHRIARLCRACHKQVHAVLTEKQLEREFNTLAALRGHPEIARFVDWVKAQPAGAHVAVRTSRDKGRR